MIRARWVGAAAVVLVLGGAAFGVQRCQPIDLTVDFPADRFSYTPHERPRVFVSHHPLNPAPNSNFKIRLAPELPDGVTVQSASAVLDDGAPQVCAAMADGIFECTLSSGSEGLRTYRGFVQLSDGRRVDSRTTYRFQVLASLPQKMLVEARVPMKPQPGLTRDYSIDTAFARDPQDYGLADFQAGVERVLYAGMLADPVYRWRDDQLGFYVFNQDAVVSSYYSKLDTRCGQNPWPLAIVDQALFPVALNAIEVVGILHRRAADDRGVEGAQGVTSAFFRDCAGTAVHRPNVRTFSASMGLGQSPFIAKHEWSHAAFHLGDEYTEDDATRRVTVAVPPLPPADDCCCEMVEIISSGGGSGGGSGGQTTVRRLGLKQCVSSDGTSGPPSPIRADPLHPTSLPTCNDVASLVGAYCGIKEVPDEQLCPSLAGDCVARSAWLGRTPPDAVKARPNVFATEGDCTDAVTKASRHSGVEAPSSGIGMCRILCGPGASACPCGAPQFWIADLNPRASAPLNLRDAMSAVTAAGPGHGGTCAWCVETSLCVRWYSALGTDSQKIWENCNAPVGESTIQALVRWLAELILRAFAAVLGNVIP